MYAKIVILKKVDDELNGGAESVTLGFFDEKGILQIEIPKVSGKLFPKNVIKGRDLVFEYADPTKSKKE